MSSDLHFKLFTDGGARGNPGPAAIGAVILDSNDILVAEFGETIGETTNNQAEYLALIAGLTAALKNDISCLICHLDSELVVRQLNHQYKVKDRKLASLFARVYDLRQKFRSISFRHIPRSNNKRADYLVNRALDNSK